VALAIAMAGARKTELRALHVVTSKEASVPDASVRRASLMRQLRESLTEADPNYGLVGAAVRQGDPGTQILRFARGLHAGMIVLGAPRSDRPERPAGPVASVVIPRSECPVLTVPAYTTTAGVGDGMFRRIVCAVDLAPSFEGIMRHALSLAWETGGRVTFVCVVQEESAVSPRRTRNDLLGAIPPEASQWCATDVIVTDGAPATEIVRLSHEREADLVVMGPPRRWTSTTPAVLSRSPCPVLVTHDTRPLPWPAAIQRGDHAAVASMKLGRS
jgi:nucleotide-binding universal stress UspA family protein